MIQTRTRNLGEGGRGDRAIEQNGKGERGPIDSLRKCSLFLLRKARPPSRYPRDGPWLPSGPVRASSESKFLSAASPSLSPRNLVVRLGLGSRARVRKKPAPGSRTRRRKRETLHCGDFLGAAPEPRPWDGGMWSALMRRQGSGSHNGRPSTWQDFRYAEERRGYFLGFSWAEAASRSGACKMDWGDFLGCMRHDFKHFGSREGAR